MSNVVTESYTYRQISATANIASVGGCLGGIFVSAASASPTITLYDSATTTTTAKIVDTFTPVAGIFYPLPFSFSNGLYVVIAGTVSASIALK